ncbi:MAG: hypothetical protein JSV33_02265 [bacterium]|nr:MAG: hypothetical protein JSV33_02265 [bacterium]
MKILLNLLVVASLIFLACCGAEKRAAEPPDLTVEEQETLVKTNSYIVLMALEAFAEDNGGWYPLSVDSDTTESGKTLVDFMPEGVLVQRFPGSAPAPATAGKA